MKIADFLPESHVKAISEIVYRIIKHNPKTNIHQGNTAIENIETGYRHEVTWGKEEFWNKY